MCNFVPSIQSSQSNNRCNKCGISTNNTLSHELNIRFSYPSKLDLQECKLILCETCLLHLLTSCIVPVELIEYDFWNTAPTTFVKHCFNKIKMKWGKRQCQI
jgi:hypothetical protein